jgi:hypothetical protein
MPGPPKSLNALVPWDRVLDLLEIAVPAPALPAVVSCPLCKHEQLDITEDYLAGGQWFFCRNCKKTGDMIELAAQAWDLSIAGTIHKFSQQGLDLPVDDATVQGYLKGHIEYRQRLRELWRQAQANLCHSTTPGGLLSKLHLPDELSAERWNAGPAKILGGESCLKIEETLLPASVVCCGNEQIPRCRSSKRIFKGGKWTEALVLPFYVAPARICAFGFIGRQGDMPSDFVFRPANVTPFIDQPYREAGLAMHPAVRKTAVEWQHTIFAVSDPLVYLQIQLRQFEQSNHPLPLVLWQDLPGKIHVRTRDAWEMCGNCKVIFWDPLMSLATLRQAIAINGWIAHCGPRRDKEDLEDYLWRCSPAGLCRQLQRCALPWPRALVGAMRNKWTDSEIEERFLQLKLEAPQLEKVRKACPPELRKRLDSILGESRQIQSFVRFDNHVVVEQPDGWYCYRQGDWVRHQELICNAKLRLSQVVNYKRTKQVCYVGTITFNGEEIPFTAPQKEIERDPFDWMQQFLLPKGFLSYNPAWKRRLLRVAALFHEPKVVAGLDVVGWDQEKLAFLLPGRIIGLKGSRKLPLSDDVSTLPAAGLRYLSVPLPTNWHELGSEYELGLFWATLAALLGNVLAPALSRETQGIGLVGEGARKMGLAVAEKAGCLVREIRTLPTARRACEEEQMHHWPLRAPIAANATRAAILQWLEGDRVSARNCITPLDEKSAAAKKAGDRWHLLTGMEPVKLKSRLLGFVRRIVPLYLRDVCKRRLDVDDVLSDLAGFIARQGGTMEVKKVRKVLFTGETGQERRDDRPRRKATVKAR